MANLAGRLKKIEQQCSVKFSGPELDLTLEVHNNDPEAIESAQEYARLHSTEHFRIHIKEVSPHGSH